MSGEDMSARLALPYLAAGQMQKHVTLNEALTRLDSLVATQVVSRTTTGQPASPEPGALYILPVGATGAAWSAGQPGSLLRFDAGGWSTIPVPEGCLIYMQEDAEFLVREAGGWVALGLRLGSIHGLDRLGLNTTADAENPFAARLDKALWTARDVAEGGSGDLRMTFNKSGPSAVLSLLMQSAFGGRAELGLVGSDDFSLRVSADGSAWSEVMTVAGATGRASFAHGSSRVEVQTFTAAGTFAVPTWARLLQITCCGGGGGGGSGASGALGAVRHGGGGGGAGGRADAAWPVEALAGSLTITIGAGGAGGSGITGGASGATGSDGTATEVVSGSVVVLTAGGGSRGLGGTNQAGTAGLGGLGNVRGNAGGAASVTAAAARGDQVTRGDASGGGGGGGGFDAAGVERAGGAGGSGHAIGDGAARGAGGNGGAAGQPGLAGASPINLNLAWAGGGGGGGGASVTAAGGTGGPGTAGGGGGGGGAGHSSALSGSGGAGGGGLVRITAIG